jgi:hypothetical protein
MKLARWSLVPCLFVVVPAVAQVRRPIGPPVGTNPKIVGPADLTLNVSDCSAPNAANCGWPGPPLTPPDTTRPTYRGTALIAAPCTDYAAGGFSNPYPGGVTMTVFDQLTGATSGYTFQHGTRQPGLASCVALYVGWVNGHLPLKYQIRVEAVDAADTHHTGFAQVAKP